MTLHLKKIHQFPPETETGSLMSKSVREETKGEEASVEIAKVFENSSSEDDNESGRSLIAVILVVINIILAKILVFSRNLFWRN